jgi:endoglucanase
MRNKCPEFIKRIVLTLLVPLTMFVTTAHALSVSNGHIFNDVGERVTLRGVNWFGFETGNRVFDGLWARSMSSYLDQMQEVGFNAIRVPFCPAVLNGAATRSINYSANPNLVGKNSIEVLDVFVDEMERRGMYYLLDHHRPDCNAISELWYINGYTEQQWIDDLVRMTTRYKDKVYFLGMDLKNEPHGAARWGSGNASVDWNKAAERAGAAVLAVAPNKLIFVEGTSDSSSCVSLVANAFWGGNVASQLCTPIDPTKIPANRLVLSPHVYGPDVFAQPYFSASNFPDNMPAIWDAHFGAVRAQGYSVVIGETGGKYGAGLASDKVFQDKLFAYLKSKDILDVFYWSWNPNSGDTGGILNDDWTTLRTDKVALLQTFWTGTTSALPCRLDIDGDRRILATTDGLMLMRVARNQNTASVINGIRFPATATRTQWSAQIQPYIAGSSFDVDGDGVSNGTDALLILRSMLGMTNEAVVNGIDFAGGATRRNWTDIRGYLTTQCGMTL